MFMFKCTITSKIELVVMNFMSVVTCNGNLYTLVFMKVSCCYLVKQLLKNKSEIRVAVQDVISKMLSQCWNASQA